MRADRQAALAGSVLAVVLTATALAGWRLAPYRFFDHGTLGAAAHARPPPPMRQARVPPLLGADGTPQPALPGAVPADARSRTLAALYATRSQAQALEDDLGGAVLWVEVDCCDEQAFAAAVQWVDAQFAERHLGLDTPVFVSGPHLQWAALVADRLTGDGYLQVFLVTRR